MANADFKEEDALGIQNPLLSPAPLGQGWLQPQFLSPLGAVSLLGLYRISGLQSESEIEPIASMNSLAISSSDQENSVQNWQTSEATIDSSEVRATEALPIQRKLVQNVPSIANSKLQLISQSERIHPEIRAIQTPQIQRKLVQKTGEVANHNSEPQPINQSENINLPTKPELEVISVHAETESQLIQQATIQNSEAIAPSISKDVEAIAHSTPEVKAFNQNENTSFPVETKTEVNSIQAEANQTQLIQREAVQNSEVIAPNIQKSGEAIAHSTPEVKAFNQDKNIDLPVETKTEVSSIQTEANQAQLIQREAIQNSEAIVPNIQKSGKTIADFNSEIKPTSKNVGFLNETKMEESSFQTEANQVQLIQQKAVQNSEAIAPSILKDVGAIAHSTPEVKAFNQDKNIDLPVETKTEVSSIQTEVNQAQLIQREAVQSSEAIAPNIQKSGETIAGFNSEIKPTQKNVGFFDETEIGENSVQTGANQVQLIQQKAVQNSEVIAPNIQKTVETIADFNSETKPTNRNENISFPVETKTEVNSIQTEANQAQLIQREVIQNSEAIAPSIQKGVETVVYSNFDRPSINEPTQIGNITNHQTETKIETSPALVEIAQLPPIQKKISLTDEISANTSNLENIETIARPSLEIQRLIEQKIDSSTNGSERVNFDSNVIQFPSVSETINQTVFSTPADLIKDNSKTYSKAESLEVNESLVQRSLEPTSADQIDRPLNNENFIQTHEAITQQKANFIQLQRSTSELSNQSEIVTTDNASKKLDEFQQKDCSLENETVINSTLPTFNSEGVKDTLPLESDKNVDSIQNTIQPKLIPLDQTAIVQSKIALDQVADNEAVLQPKTVDLEQKTSQEIELPRLFPAENLHKEKVEVQRVDFGMQKGWSVFNNSAQSPPSIEKFAPLGRQDSISLVSINDVIQRQNEPDLEQSEVLNQSGDSSIVVEISESFGHTISKDSVQRSLELSPNQADKQIGSETLDEASISLSPQASSSNLQKLESPTLSKEVEETIAPSISAEVPSIPKTNSIENPINRSKNNTSSSKLVREEVLQEKTAISSGTPSETSLNQSTSFLQAQRLTPVNLSGQEVGVESNEGMDDRLAEASINSKTYSTNQNFIQLKRDADLRNSAFLEQSSTRVDTQRMPENDDLENVLGAFNQASLPNQIIAEAGELQQDDAKLQQEGVIVSVARSLGVLENLAQLKPMGQAINLQRSNTRINTQSSRLSNLTKSHSQKSEKGNETIQQSPFGSPDTRVNSIPTQPFQEQQNSSTDTEIRSSMSDLQSIQNRLRNTRLIQAKSVDRPTNNSSIQNIQTEKSQASIELISSDQNLPSSWSSLAELAGEMAINTSANSEEIQRSINHNNPLEAKDLIFTPEGFHDANTEKSPSIQSSQNLLKVDRQKSLIQADRYSSNQASFANQNALEETIASQSEEQIMSESDHNSDHSLQILAQVIYRQLRQQLAIDRERQGHYSGRLPW
jgi:heterodisulfide reductase subunit C